MGMKVKTDNSIRYHIGNYMVIDSRVLTVFSNRLILFFNSVVFEIEFREIKNASFSMSVEQEQNGNRKIYVNNFNKSTLQGFFEPMLLGVINGEQYHFTITGLAIAGSKYKTITVNILRKIYDVQE